MKIDAVCKIKKLFTISYSESICCTFMILFCREHLDGEHPLILRPYCLIVLGIDQCGRV